MPKLLDSGLYSIVDTDGSIGVGWKLNFYRTGTTTRLDTFPTEADALAGTNPNANPLVVPSDGRLQPPWLTDTYAYKVVLTDENDVVKKTVDPVRDDGADLNEIALFPEDFGANGSSGTNQNTAFEAMMVVARTVGKATINYTPGATYTVTNPFMFGGCRELVLEMNGASQMNFRTGDPVALGLQDANFAPFRSPIGFLPNGVEVLTFGSGQGPNTNDYGKTINTVAAGATSVTTTDASTIQVGRGIIYGWDRYGTDGFPPTASYFERTRVTVAGSTATLKNKLQYGYDQTAPEKTTDDRAGVARFLSLARTAGQFRAYTEQDSLTVRNGTFIVNAGQNAAGNEAYNGVPGFGGAMRVILENIEAPNMFVTCAEYVELTGVICPGDLEIDKMIGTVVIGEGCVINNLVGAVGAMKVIIHPGAHIYGTNALAPMELLDIGAASIGGVDAFGSTAILGNYVFGSAQVRLKDTRLIANNSTVDRIVPTFKKTLTPTITSTTVMTATRAAYDTSDWRTVIRIGSVIYAGNIPVAEVTRMPYVPTPPLTTGDVAIGYKLLGGAIAGATALSIPVLQDVKINGVRIEGTYARQVTDALGSDVQAAGVKLCNLRSEQITDKGFWFDQRHSEFARASNIYEFHLGRGFRVTQIEFDVTRIAVDAGAVTGVLKAQSVADTTLALIDTIDLKTGGATARRVLASGGLTGGGGADAIGAGAFPTTAIVSIRFTDGSKALTEGNRAGWRCIVTGYWL